MDEIDLTKSEFQELLPFYVNGTIGDGERRRIDAYLALHPEAIKDIRLLQAARSTLQAEYANMDPLEGYAAFKERLDQMQPSQAKAELAIPPTKLTLLDRWNAIVGRIQGSGMVPAIAMLVALVTVPTLMIMTQKTITGEDSPGQVAVVRSDGGSSMHSFKDNQSRPGAAEQENRPVTDTTVAYLYVVFKPEASYREIVELLRANHCQIFDGPSTTGELKIEVDISDPKVTNASLKESLLASPLVMRVDAQPSQPK